jgi:hypothetical protein
MWPNCTGKDSADQAADTHEHRIACAKQLILATVRENAHRSFSVVAKECAHRPIAAGCEFF